MHSPVEGSSASSTAKPVYTHIALRQPAWPKFLLDTPAPAYYSGGSPYSPGGSSSHFGKVIRDNLQKWLRNTSATLHKSIVILVVFLTLGAIGYFDSSFICHVPEKSLWKCKFYYTKLLSKDKKSNITVIDISFCKKKIMTFEIITLYNCHFSTKLIILTSVLNTHEDQLILISAFRPELSA